MTPVIWFDNIFLVIRIVRPQWAFNLLLDVSRWTRVRVPRD